jgi:hypothetical protein
MEPINLYNAYVLIITIIKKRKKVQPGQKSIPCLKRASQENRIGYFLYFLFFPKSTEMYSAAGSSISDIRVLSPRQGACTEETTIKISTN